MEERRLDDQIREMQERFRDLSENDNNRKYNFLVCLALLLFVTEEDIKGIPCFQNESLIAIKAPHGTTLEVPDPDEDFDYRQRRYGIFLRSTMGPIFVYLVSQFEEKFEEMNGVEQPLSVPLASSSGSNENQVELVNTSVGGMMRIVPSDTDVIWNNSLEALVTHLRRNDADYWLLSDADFSIMDMWMKDWSGVDTLHSDFGMAEVVHQGQKLHLLE
ncbi:hypothetical protein GOBAR_DD34865 [Gossypium barbadense]|nr:hypothetical protein GOBAR_DD34865 [Gossypium barbadense]